MVGRFYYFNIIAGVGSRICAVVGRPESEHRDQYWGSRLEVRWGLSVFDFVFEITIGQGIQEQRKVMFDMVFIGGQWNEYP